MKTNRIHARFRFRLGGCLLVLLAGVACATAKSTVPGPDDYTKFSTFITDRNIFDPNRVAHNYSTTRRYTRPTKRSYGTPGIQLVGTMSYEKGMLAFFSGKKSDLSKVAQSGEQIVGYKITSITPDSVGLESADKKEQLELKIGDGF